MLRFILLLTISLLLPATQAMAQQKRQYQRTIEAQRSKIAEWLDLTDSIPVFQGVNLMVDAVGPGWYAFGGDFLSTEVALEVNLLNRFFPVVEVGYGQTDAVNEDTELHYRTAAPYFRIGANYNVQYKKKRPGYIYAGFRLGYTSFDYDVDGPPMVDPVWGGELPFHLTDIQSRAFWGELLVGVRAQVYRNFHMGWSFRYKVRFNVKNSPNASPWYIPGFGANENNKFGVTYDLVYQIPWKRSGKDAH